MIPKTDIIDIHTHRLGISGSVVSIDPVECGVEPVGLFSVAIHPWNVLKANDSHWATVEIMAASPMCVALGETGLDRLCGIPIDAQMYWMERQCRLAIVLDKPVIVHCVGCAAEVTALYRRLKPSRPWVIHGFRGKPQLARQLLGAGLWLSFGCRFNPESAAIVPPDRLLAETDCGPCPISEVVGSLAAARGENPASLQHRLQANSARFFS